MSVDYCDLPLYIVYSGNLSRSCKDSYGICLRAPNGKRLMIKSLNTFSFCYFFKGAYHQAKIPFLVKNMTKKEYDILLTCLEDVNVYNTTFESIHQKPYNETTREYCLRRLRQSEKMLRRCSHLASPSSSYFYPKGQLKKKEKGFDCAKRELLEETGVDITKYKHTVEEETLTYKMAGPSGLVYNSTIYIVNVEEELNCWVNDKTEVKKIKWRYCE